MNRNRYYDTTPIVRFCWPMSMSMSMRSWGLEKDR